MAIKEHSREEAMVFLQHSLERIVPGFWHVYSRGPLLQIEADGKKFATIIFEEHVTKEQANSTAVAVANIPAVMGAQVKLLSEKPPLADLVRAAKAYQKSIRLLSDGEGSCKDILLAARSDHELSILLASAVNDTV